MSNSTCSPDSFLAATAATATTTTTITNAGSMENTSIRLSCVGRLNNKWINKLQNYYRLATCQNTDSLILMRKVVGAVLYHCSEARHIFCHKDSQWCKMRQAEKFGIPYADKPGLPVAVRDAIMPIFQEFSKPELLENVFMGNPKLQCTECFHMEALTQGRFRWTIRIRNGCMFRDYKF